MSMLIGCFLVFAGMMIGYLLWYRDRHEENQVRQQLKNELSVMAEKLQLANDERWESEDQIIRQRNQIDVLKQLCEDWSQSREKIEVERAELQVSLQQRQEKYEKVMGQLLACQEKMVEIEDELITHHKSLQHDSNHQQLVAWENRELKLQLQSAQQNIETSQENIRHLESQLAATTGEIERLHAENVAMRSRLGNQESTIDRLQQKQCELVAKIEQKTELNELIQSELSQRDDQADRRNRKLDEYQVRLQNSEETIRRLQRQRNELKAELQQAQSLVALQDSIVTRPSDSIDKNQSFPMRLAPQVEFDSTVVSFSQAMEARQRSQFDNVYGAHFQRHPVLGMVYTEAPKHRDDLKRISGIAEILEARLNDLGIYTFKQIMEWSPEAIREVAHLFQFKDRIERDCWQEQAESLFRRESELQVESEQRAA